MSRHLARHVYRQWTQHTYACCVLTHRHAFNDHYMQTHNILHMYTCRHTWCKWDKSPPGWLLSQANWNWPSPSALRVRKCRSAEEVYFGCWQSLEPKFFSPIQPGHFALIFIMSISSAWNRRLFTRAGPVSFSHCKERPEVPPESSYLTALLPARSSPIPGLPSVTLLLSVYSLLHALLLLQV